MAEAIKSEPACVCMCVDTLSLSPLPEALDPQYNGNNKATQSIWEQNVCCGKRR